MTEQVRVNQADRNAAADFGIKAGQFGELYRRAIEDGKWDATENVQAFARHRLAHQPASDVRESGEALARRFHETYERLAPSFGYETRAETREFDPESPNGKLMVAVCSALRDPAPDAGWRRVLGWEDKYQVSREGEVKTLGGRVLGQWFSQGGYTLVRLSGPRRMASVHRLVAGAFLENPLGLPNVNHIDNNPANNHVDNLEWCTQRHNLEHMTLQGRRSRHRLGTRSPSAFLSDSNAIKLREIYAAGGITFAELGAQFGVSKSAAQRCVSGKTYSRLLPAAPAAVDDAK